MEGKRGNGDNSGSEDTSRTGSADTSREKDREADLLESDLTRRGFLGGTGAALVVAGVPTLGTAEISPATVVAQEAAAVPQTTIRVTINGSRERVEVEDRWTLNELLRDHFGLTGSKIGCNRGECGACTVIINGRNHYSCSQLAIWLEGKEILTIEGLAHGGKLDPLQQAFIENDGPQCGFCTSGQIMAGKALLLRNSSPTEAQVRRALSGNLCRCGNYNREVAAVLAAAKAR
jgi:xanthine dehydrogenase YagT iron-sulfur-binding subunit